MDGFTDARSPVTIPYRVLLAGLVLFGCAQDPPVDDDAWATEPSTAEAAAGFDLASAELIDLSHSYGEDTLYWPTSPSAFELEELANGVTDGGYYYSSYRLSTPEHGGTHLDSPVHFARDGWSVERIPLDRLIVPAVVLDVTEQTSADPDYRLTLDELSAWEAEHGPVAEGSAVLLRTGWSRFWPEAKAYLGDDTPGDASNLHFPSFGVEAAKVLIEERGVVVLGVDTASIDYGPSTLFEVHQLAGAANVVGLENLADLDRMPPTGAWLIALPMKIAGGSGAPVRVVGVLP